MSQANRQRRQDAEQTVFRTIPTDPIEFQASIQHLESCLKNQVHLELKPGGTLRVRYNAVEIGFDRVLEQLQQLGITPRNTQWFRIRAAWYRYVDANVAAQAKMRPKPCCNRVPRL